MKRDILTIFLASPSDLENERKITRDVVDRINKVASRRVGWQIELLVWEDTLPGYSRPQDIINKDVDSCDLFLGLLWKRWGQSTGKYSSGFHEEFLRARERHNNSGKPEIWLFFKAIEIDNLEDPGEQLKQVLEFKKEQITKQELFFNEFEQSQNWEKIIYDKLIAYVLDIGKNSQNTNPEKNIPTNKDTGKEIVISNGQEQRKDTIYPTELGLITQKTNNYINGNESAELDFWDKTRLFLLANSWFSSVYLLERLGVHEINLVFSKRKVWKLSKEELQLIFLTMLTDKYGTCPGWYWFQKNDENIINNRLCDLLLLSNDKEVQEMGFKLMTKLSFRPPINIIEEGLSNSKSEVVLKIIELLSHIGLSQDIDLLEKALNSNNSEIKKSAIAARLDIQYREEPNNAFLEYIDIGGNTPIFIDNAFKKMNLLVDEHILLDALKSTHVEVRRFSAVYLRQLEKLDSETAKRLLEDADREVRRQALWSLIDHGEKITHDQVKKLFPSKKVSRPYNFGLFFGSTTPDYETQKIYDEFFVSTLKYTPPLEILKSIEAYDSHIEDMYYYMAVNHFNLMENKIRNDLENEFEYITNELEQKKWESDTINYIKAKMIGAALSGLAEHGNENDIKYARKFLGNTRHNTADPEALELIIKYGDISDVPKILEVAQNNYELKQIAYKTALMFTNEKEKILEIMLKEGVSEVSKKAAEELLTINDNKVIEILKEMLHSENENQRLISLALLVYFFKKEQLEIILDDYIKSSSYYYNVVTWLDKTLYAPGRYGEFFRKELIEKI